jgi:hypothetical protein
MSCKPANSTAAPWGADESQDIPQRSSYVPPAGPPPASFKPAHSTGAPWGMGETHEEARPTAASYGAQQAQSGRTQSCKPAHSTAVPWGADESQDIPQRSSYVPPVESPPASFKPAHSTGAPWGSDRDVRSRQEEQQQQEQEEEQYYEDAPQQPELQGPPMVPDAMSTSSSFAAAQFKQRNQGSGAPWL